MIKAIEKNVVQPISEVFPSILKEDSEEFQYYYLYKIKILMRKSHISKWSTAQRLLSSYPIDSLDEEVIINNHIKPGLEDGVKYFNKGNLYNRRMDLLSVCKDELAVVLLLSCREEQSVDNINNKLWYLSKRLFALRQFNKFLGSNSDPRLIKFFSVQVKKIDKI